jgi:hypothetical protein
MSAKKRPALFCEKIFFASPDNSMLTRFLKTCDSSAQTQLMLTLPHGNDRIDETGFAAARSAGHY